MTRKANPDPVAEMAQRGARLQQTFQDQMGEQPGEESMTTDDLAAKYLAMDFTQRVTLFHELLASNGPDGIELAGDIMKAATKMYQEDTGGA